jgi:hypothetical protein
MLSLQTIASDRPAQDIHNHLFTYYNIDLKRISFSTGHFSDSYDLPLNIEDIDYFQELMSCLWITQKNNSDNVLNGTLSVQKLSFQLRKATMLFHQFLT